MSIAESNERQSEFYHNYKEPKPAEQACEVCSEMVLIASEGRTETCPGCGLEYFDGTEDNNIWIPDCCYTALEDNQ